jgi:predicted kinase
MATIHLICGSTGAGKSSYASRLAKETNGVLFTLDDWMTTLFWPDAPSNVELSWALERVKRSECQIWKICCQIISKQIDVILDSGFSKREHRDLFRAMAKGIGVPTKLHYVDAGRDVRRERVRRRNRHRGETFSLEVSDAVFEWMEGYFEVPAECELQGAQVVFTDSSIQQTLE